MTVEHRLVDTLVLALVALERFVAGMIALVVLKVVLILGDKLTRITGQQFFRFHVQPQVLPVVELAVALVGAVPALVGTLLWHRLLVVVVVFLKNDRLSGVIVVVVWAPMVARLFTVAAQGVWRAEVSVWWPVVAAAAATAVAVRLFGRRCRRRRWK